MKNIIWVVIVLSVSACATTPTSTPLKCNEQKTSINNVNVVWLSRDDIHKQCQGFGLIKHGAVNRACSGFNKTSGVLTIYAVKPVAIEDYDAFSSLGHELMHGLCLPMHD